MISDWANTNHPKKWVGEHLNIQTGDWSLGGCEQQGVPGYRHMTNGCDML